MKSGLINGLMAGLLLAGLYLIVNFIAPKLNFGFTYAILSSSIIYILFMVRAAKQEKKKLDTPFGFGDALIPAMICYGLASLIYLVFTFLIFKFDPSQMEMAQQASIESMESISEMMGVEEGKILEDMEENQENIFKQYTNLGMYLINWFVSLIFPGLILGAIAAAIAKDKVTTA